MDTLERAAMSRARDAIAFAFNPSNRVDLLAEAGIYDVDAALRVGRSPDSRLHVLLPEIEQLEPHQAAALLLTCVQALYDAIDKVPE